MSIHSSIVVTKVTKTKFNHIIDCQYQSMENRENRFSLFLLLRRIFLNGTWLPLWSACDVVLRLPVCSLPSLAGSMRAKSLRGNVLFCRNSADKPQYDGNFPASGGLRTIPKVRHRRLAVGGVFCPPRLLFSLNENNIFNKSCSGFFCPYVASSFGRNFSWLDV